VGDRIDPITPRPPSATAIPAIRRSDGSAERREHDASQPRKRRPPPAPQPPPPDDGRPHIDVRV
jgi:hypothetical protein